MLTVKPIAVKEAERWVRALHRRLPSLQHRRWAVSAVNDSDEVVGVAVVGDPSARMLRDGWTGEIVRVATDGSKNCCSLLYGACRSAARAMGYRRLFTYIHDDEDGASLRAAGFIFDRKTGGGEWHRGNRPRGAVADAKPKQRYMAWAN